MTVSDEISLLLHNMTPASVRGLMVNIARYIRAQNVARITGQKNADGSVYQPRANGGKKPMLTGYARRIRGRIETDRAIVGVFGRMGNFGSVHDKGRIERRVKYPSRNILSMPPADQAAILQMLRSHVGGAA
jgi:phage virion morphogenesis protein